MKEKGTNKINPFKKGKLKGWKAVVTYIIWGLVVISVGIGVVIFATAMWAIDAFW